MKKRSAKAPAPSQLSFLDDNLHVTQEESLALARIDTVAIPRRYSGTVWASVVPVDLAVDEIGHAMKVAYARSENKGGDGHSHNRNVRGVLGEMIASKVTGLQIDEGIYRGGDVCDLIVHGRKIDVKAQRPDDDFWVRPPFRADYYMQTWVDKRWNMGPWAWVGWCTREDLESAYKAPSDYAHLRWRLELRNLDQWHTEVFRLLERAAG